MKVTYRTFSTAAAQRPLAFAKRCDIGQGSQFKLHHLQSKVDLSYSTFWNDFSHYSAYYSKEIDQVRDFRVQGESKREENLIFEAKEDYIDLENNEAGSVNTTQST